MTTDLIDFAQYLRWSNSTFRRPLLWKQDYIQFLKDRAAPFVEQKKELADAVRDASDDQLTETLFCPRVLWALTQVMDRDDAIQEMLSELTIRQAINDQQPQAVSGLLHSSSCSVNLKCAGIVIDFESAFELPGEFQSLVAAPTRRQSVEYQRINSALTELELTFPAVFLFVKDLTSRIAVRFRPESPRFTMFGSFTEYPGVMLIVNPWQVKMDVAQMVEAIVHENIHHAIAMFEAVRHNSAGNCSTPIPPDSQPTPLERIVMNIAQLLHPFALTPNVEIIIPWLPKWLVRLSPGQLSRNDLFEGAGPPAI